MPELVTLDDCPPGLFLHNGAIHLKTEYTEELPPGGGQWWPLAYVGASGEFFWGGALTHEERAKLMVRPLDAEAIASSI